MLEESQIKSQQAERPSCITVYAILLVLGGGLTVILALVFLLGFSFAGLGTGELFFLASGVFGGGYLLFLALLSILSDIGIWGMKMWGWWLVVITQVISIASLIFEPLFQVASGRGGFDASVSCSALLPVIVLAWFLRNRHKFGG